MRAIELERVAFPSAAICPREGNGPVVGDHNICIDEARHPEGVDDTHMCQNPVKTFCDERITSSAIF